MGIDAHLPACITAPWADPTVPTSDIVTQFLLVNEFTASRPRSHPDLPKLPWQWRQESFAKSYPISHK